MSENLVRDDPEAAGRKGGLARAANLRARREQRELDAEERLLDAVDRALEVLVETLEAGEADDDGNVSPDHRARLVAAERLLDRALGKPRQRHEHAGVAGDPIRIALSQARDDLSTRIAARAKRRGAGEADR